MVEETRLSSEFVKQLVQVVKQVLRAEHGGQDHTPRHGQRDTEKWGVMHDTLLAPANGLTTPTTGTANDLRKTSDGDFELSGTTTEITHRFENITVMPDTLVRYKFLYGEWTLTAIDCDVLGSPP